MAARKLIVMLGVAVVLLATAGMTRGAECRGPLCRNRLKCDTMGVSCHDCHSRLVCTPLGGIVIPCWIPGLSHCSNGRCVREPSEECLPTTTTKRPPPTTEATSTTGSTSTSEEPASTTEESTSTTQPTEPTSTTEGPSTEASSTTSIPSTTDELSTTGVPSTTEKVSTTGVPSPSTTEVVFN